MKSVDNRFTSYCKNIRCTPRKMSLATQLVQRQTAKNALLMLKFRPQKSCALLAKIILSAVANTGENLENLKILEIQLGRGRVLKRMMPRARSRTDVIEKRYSNVRVILGGYHE